jgi:hypothetical protein
MQNAAISRTSVRSSSDFDPMHDPNLVIYDLSALCQGDDLYSKVKMCLACHK